jgi:DNA-binding transcriptional regulator YbjK
MTHSPISNLHQYYYEYQTWKRLLDFFKQENAYLKTRLSEVVDHNTDKEFLALAENFQNQFIVQDEFIDELKKDVHAMEMRLKEDGLVSKTIPDKKKEVKQNKLRNEIEYLEKNFTSLKNEFNKYLIANL